MQFSRFSGSARARSEADSEAEAATPVAGRLRLRAPEPDAPVQTGSAGPGASKSVRKNDGPLGCPGAPPPSDSAGLGVRAGSGVLLGSSGAGLGARFGAGRGTDLGRAGRAGASFV